MLLIRSKDQLVYVVKGGVAAVANHVLPRMEQTIFFVVRVFQLRTVVIEPNDYVSLIEAVL